MFCTVVIAVQLGGKSSRIKVAVQIVHGCLHINIRMAQQHLVPGLEIRNQLVQTGLVIIGCFDRVR